MNMYNMEIARLYNYTYIYFFLQRNAVYLFLFVLFDYFGINNNGKMKCDRVASI